MILEKMLRLFLHSKHVDDAVPLSSSEEWNRVAIEKLIRILEKLLVYPSKTVDIPQMTEH